MPMPSEQHFCPSDELIQTKSTSLEASAPKAANSLIPAVSVQKHKSLLESTIHSLSATEAAGYGCLTATIGAVWWPGAITPQWKIHYDRATTQTSGTFLNVKNAFLFKNKNNVCKHRMQNVTRIYWLNPLFQDSAVSYTPSCTSL